MMRMICFACAAMLLIGCVPQDHYAGVWVARGSYSVEAGDTLRGDLLITGGNVNVARGSRITGSVYLLDGVAALDGDVAGDVTMLGGVLALGPNAVVSGSLSAGGTLQRAPTADVRGGVQTTVNSLPEMRATQSVEGRIITGAVSALLAAALAWLLMRVRPAMVANMRDALQHNLIVCAAMGLLAGVAALVLFVLMAFTVILIPVTIFGMFLMGMAVLLGWVGFGAWVGRRLRVGAVAGVLLFLAAMNVLAWVPWLDLIPLVLSAAGLGAVLLTRFGWSRFVPAN